MRTPNNERLTPDIDDAEPVRATGRGKACPERRCILTGVSGDRAALIRLAVSPDGLVLPDVHARAPGRGAWLGVDRAALETAMGLPGAGLGEAARAGGDGIGRKAPGGKLKAALARAFKTGALDIPADLPDRIEGALRRALADRLGLEMRAGTLILGTQRIAETARAGGAVLVLHASDASEDGRKKLDQAWRVGQEREGSGDRGAILPLDRAALSVALGRDNVVHLALADARAAVRVMAVLGRLQHFLGSAPGTETADGATDAGTVAEQDRAPAPGDGSGDGSGDGAGGGVDPGGGRGPDRADDREGARASRGSRDDEI